MPHGDISIPGRAIAPGISLAMMAVLASGCGLIAAGSYFAQPLTAVIGRDVGLPPTIAGLIVTVGQLGYVLGLLLVAPLGDLVENRRLLLGTLAASALSLTLAALAPDGVLFLIACFCIGISSIAVQMLVTLGAVMSAPARRGLVIGSLTGGLLVGILLAWPVASFTAGHWGWRVPFGGAAAAMVTLAAVLSRATPRRWPASGPKYGALVLSLGALLRTTPELRGRAAMQAFLFGGFSLFWTAAPIELVRHYALGANTIALFGLIGGTGALIAPLAGRLADAGRGRIVSLVGVIAVITAFVVAAFASRVWMLAGAAFLLNAGVQANHVISQRAVLSMRPEAGSRLNSLYIAIFFLGGAAGSAIAAPLALTGWSHLGLVGAVLGLMALLLWTEAGSSASLPPNA
ncbi:MAG: MFS transporter [Acetobacteraceae bacterium]|nr:MFS transporter [Acetobacteraceae bacterium]